MEQQIIRKLEEVIDISQYIVSKAVRTTYQPKITITEKGEIRMNSTLKRQTEERFFALAFSKDFREILLIPECSSAVKFNKNGVVRDAEILSFLEKKKMPFPLEYQVRWDEKRCLFEGNLDVNAKK